MENQDEWESFMILIYFEVLVLNYSEGVISNSKHASNASTIGSLNEGKFIFFLSGISGASKCMLTKW